jgi:hypothetical protein
MQNNTEGGPSHELLIIWLYPAKKFLKQNNAAIGACHLCTMLCRCLTGY